VDLKESAARECASDLRARGGDACGKGGHLRRLAGPFGRQRRSRRLGPDRRAGQRRRHDDVQARAGPGRIGIRPRAGGEPAGRVPVLPSATVGTCCPPSPAAASIASSRRDGRVAAIGAGRPRLRRAKYADPHMPPGSAMVNVSWVHPHETTPNVAPHVASRGGMATFTRAVATAVRGRPDPLVPQLCRSDVPHGIAFGKPSPRMRTRVPRALTESTG
jgi:hypothetical protein